MRLSLFVFIALVLTIGAGCNKKIQNQGDGPAAVASSKAAMVVRALEDNALSTEHFEGRARVKVESKDLNVGGTAIIRVERDKAIWVSVKKFGFEGVRALVRPDSFFVFNRLKNEYTAEALSYVEERYKIPARFDLLQEMFMGNAVFFSRKLKLDTEGENYILTGQDRRFATRHVVDAQRYLLREMDLTELGQDRKVMIENSSFRPLEGVPGQPDFPYERTIRVEAEGKSGVFELAFSKVAFDGPYAMPFRRR